jgi:hypothetical protein
LVYLDTFAIKGIPKGKNLINLGENYEFEIDFNAYNISNPPIIFISEGSDTIEYKPINIIDTIFYNNGNLKYKLKPKRKGVLNYHIFYKNNNMYKESIMWHQEIKVNVK